MASVSFRVPDEVKARMDEYDEINWSAVLRDQIEEELQSLEAKNVAHAVATSERLSGTIDVEEVATTNSAEQVRKFRDTRYSEG